MAEKSNHAVVYGASGLIGWAVVDELLRSAQPVLFSNVTAVTNRPLKASESFWPEKSHQPDLQLVSGINLRHGNGTELADSLKKVVKDIETVTHIYYLGMSPQQHLCTGTHRQQFSQPRATIPRRSRPTVECFRTSSTRTQRSALP